MNKITQENDLYVFLFSIGKFLKCTKTLMLMAMVNRPAPQTVMLMCSANALGPMSQMYHMDYVSTS